MPARQRRLARPAARHGREISLPGSHLTGDRPLAVLLRARAACGRPDAGRGRDGRQLVEAALASGILRTGPEFSLIDALTNNYIAPFRALQKDGMSPRS